MSDVRKVPENAAELDALSAQDYLQWWLEEEFGEDIHHRGSELGYYSGSAGDRMFRAHIRYYGGGLEGVKQKLNIVAALFDEMQVAYTWRVGSYEYPYLLVDMTTGAPLPKPRQLLPPHQS